MEAIVTENVEEGQEGCAENSKEQENKADAELPVDVQQEIEDLCHFVPEVSHHFKIINKIGEGTFSSVFLARLKHHPEVQDMFALKHIIPTSHPKRILGELRCLLFIGGVENVMGLELCLRNKDHIVIVMPYFPHHKFQDYLPSLDVSDVREYMRNLLIALRRVHHFDIIHRDIKPSNFLCNTATKQYALVDFGLAHDAPVRLQEFNKGGSPLVVEQMPGCPQKESRNKSVKQGSHGENKAGDAWSIFSPPPPPPSRSTTVPDTEKREPLSPTKNRQPTVPNTAEGRLGGHSRRGHPSPRRALLAHRVMTAQQESDRKKGLGVEDKSAQPSKRAGHRQGTLATCQCFGRPTICSICNGRSIQLAPRAGTPGFRAPEVLMKHPQQSTAVDMWSAGVIFLSLLSGRYPFFRANDDLTCLSQIISLLGTEEVQKSAQTYGKVLTCRPVTRPLDLKHLCLRLRSSPESSEGKPTAVRQWTDIPDSAIDLLKQLLDPNPASRITAAQALQHRYFTEEPMLTGISDLII